MRRVLCLCNDVKALDLSTRLVVITHKKELKSTSNTGRLAALALKNSEVRIRGDEAGPMDTVGMFTPGRRAFILFPSESAEVLDADFVARNPGPYDLLAPDGTWHQSSKMIRREPVLQGVPHVKLAAGAPSRYQLRREPNAMSFATFEAIARALGVLEGAEVQAHLDHLFDLMVERVLWSRGLLPLKKCRFPIPQAAIDEFFIAGARGKVDEGPLE